VKWKPHGDAGVARRWLEKYGFRVSEMRATPGAIVLGTDKQVEDAFVVSLKDVKPPSNLNVPNELRDQIESISILKPPSYQL
jgi:hypothetical protein